MSADSPFYGEITLWSGSYAPVNWAFCDGSLLSISQYPNLFNLLGTNFGGDGITSFALPDLRGRVPLHMGQSPSGTTYTLGNFGGLESVNLTPAQLPAHTHTVTGELYMKVRGNDPDNALSAVNNGLAIAAGKRYFSRNPTASGKMKLDSTVTLAPAGSSVGHTNMQPYLAVNFIISLYGFYPTPS